MTGPTSGCSFGLQPDEADPPPAIDDCVHCGEPVREGDRHRRGPDGRVVHDGYTQPCWDEWTDEWKVVIQAQMRRL